MFVGRQTFYGVSFDDVIQFNRFDFAVASAPPAPRTRPALFPLVYSILPSVSLFSRTFLVAGTMDNIRDT